MQFLSSPDGPTGNDLGFSDAYPDYFLGIGNGFFQGSAQHETRAQHFFVFVRAR